MKSFIMSGLLLFVFLSIFFNDGTMITCEACTVKEFPHYLQIQGINTGNKDSVLNIPWESIKMYTNDKHVYDSIMKQGNDDDSLNEMFDSPYSEKGETK